MTIMKVLLLNGSPRKEGCTYTALTEIAETLKKNGVEAEIFRTFLCFILRDMYFTV